MNKMEITQISQKQIAQYARDMLCRLHIGRIKSLEDVMDATSGADGIKISKNKYLFIINANRECDGINTLEIVYFIPDLGVPIEIQIGSNHADFFVRCKSQLRGYKLNDKSTYDKFRNLKQNKTVSNEWCDIVGELRSLAGTLNNAPVGNN